MNNELQTSRRNILKLRRKLNKRIRDNYENKEYRETMTRKVEILNIILEETKDL